MALSQELPDLVGRRLQAGVRPHYRLPAVSGGTAVRGESGQAAAGTLKKIFLVLEEERGDMEPHAGGVLEEFYSTQQKRQERKRRGWEI